ncbi:hypothetical protein FHR84_004028 [Actinopolyspora biskrensis]|uniref:2'-5' RNA ligase superfamily protein n=1 Tax=Actinopolyspora biskrensis TaxID=1470178 RepID=A0A852Z3T4_9ACTN|nr:hypothetical protein [Actinopolyspora biskrensis]
MPRDGRTGLVIPVPEADTVLGPVCERYPEAVRREVPAHVSVLFPFLAADELGERVFGELRELFDEQPPLRVSWRECARHGGFVYLRPDPPGPVQRLMDAVQRRWPDVVPYEGRHEVVEPHLTVATGTSRETAVAIQRTVTELLPVTAELSEVWLVVFEGQWRIRERFALRARPDRSGDVRERTVS